MSNQAKPAVSKKRVPSPTKDDKQQIRSQQRANYQESNEINKPKYDQLKKV